MEKTEAKKQLKDYEKELRVSELSERTIKKYLFDIHQWLEAQSSMIDNDTMIQYKGILSEKYAASSINSKLISINRYLKWLGHRELQVKTKRIQTESSLEHTISKSDYLKMLEYAKGKNKMKMFCIMRTIALTGIRIGELQYITVEAVRDGSTEVYNKGKYRRIYLPARLCSELSRYCEEKDIEAGFVFTGRDKTKSITPSTVWRNLKYIGMQAGVPEKNVYPHSFRHLFAKTYMSEIGDITELSDLLGHSRLETTWIYTKTTSEEKRSRLNKISL